MNLTAHGYFIAFYGRVFKYIYVGTRTIEMKYRKQHLVTVYVLLYISYNNLQIIISMFPVIAGSLRFIGQMFLGKMAGLLNHGDF